MHEQGRDDQLTDGARRSRALGLLSGVIHKERWHRELHEWRCSREIGIIDQREPARLDHELELVAPAMFVSERESTRQDMREREREKGRTNLTAAESERMQGDLRKR